MLRHLYIVKNKNAKLLVFQPSCLKSSLKTDPKPTEQATSQNEGTTAPSSDEKNRFEEAEKLVEKSDVRKKSIFGVFVDKLKTKVDSAAFDPIPSQYKHTLMKGMVLNEIDPAMLIYPEYDETAYVDETELFAKSIETMINSKLDSAECDKTKHLPDQVIQECKQLGLYGLQISKKYGGLGLCNKAVVRCHEELSRDWSLYTMLSAHNDLAVRAIQLFGTDDQKSKYLPRLASGESIGAFCLHEPESGQDSAALTTTVSRSKADFDCLQLNGTKSWVTNGVNADILVVFAKISPTVKIPEALIPTTAFIIDRKSSQGIIDIDRKDTMGLRAVNISGIQFNNVKIAENCLLGVEENGFFVAQKTMAANRYLFPAAAAACLKRNLSGLTKHCNATKRYEAMLSDANCIKKKVCKMSREIFTLETMAYYMAGWMDDDPSKDFSIEGAIATRYARRVLQENLMNMIEIYGAEARTSNLSFEQLLRDILTLRGFNCTDDFLSGYVASEAFKVFASENHKVLYLAKNSIQYPAHFMKDRSKRVEMYFTDLKMKHYINEHVHPSLEDSARFIENTMARFSSIFKSVVYSTGKFVEEEHITLERVTDIMTNLFVMLTTISRASRSYCIGLKNADHEMYFAESLCTELKVKTTHLLIELIDIDAPNTIDVYNKKIGETILQNRGYTIEKPTTRNW